MVKARLPFFDDTKPKVADAYATIKAEVMDTLYKLFYPEDDIVTNPTWQDDESRYNNMQKMMVADIISILLLLRRSLEDSSGIDDEGNVSDGTIIKKAKGGDAEVEFESRSKEGFSFGTKFETTFLNIRSAAKDRFMLYPIYVYNNLLGVPAVETIFPPRNVRNNSCHVD